MSMTASVSVSGAFSATSGAPPIDISGKYRTSQQQLFVDIAATTPTLRGGDGYMVVEARGSISAPKTDYSIAGFGPRADYVDAASQWTWVNDGGDWVNTAGTSQATTSPHASFTANSVTTGSASYTASITAGLTAALTRGKWNAYIVRTSGSYRSIASPHHATLDPPSISVTYTDSSTATLACLACVAMTIPPSTLYTQVGDDEAQVWNSAGYTVALEFEMPTQAVSSATLNITLSQHTASAATVQLFLADPPVNSAAVTAGLSEAYPLDSGISAHADVLFSQRYQDGTTLSDFIIPTPSSVDFWDVTNWDPGIYGDTDDTTKLPTAISGVAVAGTNKWINKVAAPANISLVSSSYTGDGFVPYAEGLGALRVVIPGTVTTDGANVGNAGELGCDLLAMFPKAICGIVDDVYVRFAVRFAFSPTALADTKMYRPGSGASAEYVVPRGKFGPGIHHWTKYGGNSGYPGSQNRGWSNRLGYTEHPSDLALGGIIPYVHSYDNFADGHNMLLGGDGGLGSSFYPDRWYDIEVRCKLNTYTAGVGTADGVMEIWIDGRLAATHTGWMYRDGAIDYVTTTPRTTYLAPFRDLGAIGLTLNNFNGYILPPDKDLVMFYGPMVAATSRIGPIKAATPAWVPAAGDAAVISAAGVLNDIRPNIQTWNPDAPATGPWETSNVYQFSTIAGYCSGCLAGAPLNKWVAMGGGHAQINIPAFYAFDIATLAWEWLDTPLPSDGLDLATGADNSDLTVARSIVSAAYPADMFDPIEWEWLGGSTSWPSGYEQPGKIQPEPAHNYFGTVWVPGTSVGNTNGIILKLYPGSGRLPECLVPTRHYFDLDDMTWKHTPNYRSNPSAAAGGSIYFGGTVDRVFSITNTSGGQFRSVVDVFTPSTLTWSTANTTNTTVIQVYSGGLIAHLASNMLIHCCPSPSQAGSITYVSATQHQFWVTDAVALKTGSTATWTQLTISNPGGTWPIRQVYGTTCGSVTWTYCPVNECFYAVNGEHGSTQLWKLAPPAGASTYADYRDGTWTVSAETLATAIPSGSTGSATGSVNEPYNRLVWSDAAGCLLWFDYWISNKPVAIRPTGV